MLRFFARLLPLPALLLLSADVFGSSSSSNGDGLAPIELTVAGPNAVRVRIARGMTFPCDSGDNRLLFSAKIELGQVARTSTPDQCVCFQQTFAPFADVDWGASTIVCRPQICRSHGRARYCIPAPDPTIRLSIQSTRPG